MKYCDYIPAIPSKLVLLCCAANFINAADRVIMPWAVLAMAKQYNYSLYQQGWILSAFPFGYISSQIVGSCAGAQFGGKRLLLFVVFMWSISTAVTPLVAYSFHMLIFSRIILGLGEGLGVISAKEDLFKLPTFIAQFRCHVSNYSDHGSLIGLPTIYHIFAQTIPLENRSTAFSYLAAFGSIGQTLAAVLTPHTPWPFSFYFFGCAGLIWCIVWFRYGEAPVSLTDQLLLCNKTPNLLSRLRSFLTAWPLVAIYVAHFSMNWTSYVVMHWLPTYLHHTFDANPAWLSLACLPYLLNSAMSIVVGHVADWLISKHRMSLVRVRKLMTAIGLIGPAVLLLWFSAISHFYSAVALISLTMGFLAFNSAGHLSNHADVCSRYAGISFAISNTIATAPGLLVGPMTANLVTQSSGRWFPVFWLASAMNFVGAIVYLSHASSSQLFD